MTRIYFKNDCAWFPGGYTPTDRERKLMTIVTESLPLVPATIKVDGIDLVLLAGYNGTEFSWAEYVPYHIKEDPTNKT